MRRAPTPGTPPSREAFLAAYLAHVRRDRPPLLPAEVDAPLAALELEKAAYEVLYELNNRPDWLPIPLAALLRWQSDTLSEMHCPPDAWR